MEADEARRTPPRRRGPPPRAGPRCPRQGRELIDAVYGQHVRAQSALLADLDDDELAELDRLLRKGRGSIDRHAAGRDLPVRAPSTRARAGQLSENTRSRQGGADTR
ncbi:hypothetical protein HBB16_07195 [Pseudonocardia sp. MCCB 268]|nr:hypothetical protein [Pseudonocardia cytotoxica]